MQITEPTTMITDYILALLSLFFFFTLFRQAREPRRLSRKFWAGAFLATAIAALVGGTSHGFALYFDQTSAAAIWKVTVYSIGVASFFMLLGTALASISGLPGKFIAAVAVLQFVIYCLWMMSHDDFKYVIYQYVPAMVGVVLLQIYAALKRKDASAVWLISGVLLSFIAAQVQQSGYSLHLHFNHNDLYHVIQMGALYLLYRGARLLQDRPKMT